MSTQQAKLESFGTVTKFERLTGVRGTTERQLPDGDRVSDEEAPDLDSGLDDAYDNDVEVEYR